MQPGSWNGSPSGRACPFVRAERAQAQPFGFDWYIDIDHVAIDDDCWRIEDRFLDVIVYEGRSYQLLDADELAEGIEAEEITVAESVAALRSVHLLVTALRQLEFSGAALLSDFAPGLPG